MSTTDTTTEAPATEERMRYTVRTWADGFGRVHAEVRTAWTLSENEPRARYNAGTYWDSIRATARRAIRRALVERDAIGEGHRVRVEVAKVLDPYGRNYGSGLIDGVEYVEAGE